jgi:hypothetical protein
MPVPSPLRLVVGVLSAVVMSVALYFFVQGAVMLYELYQFTQWVKEFGE